DQTPAAPILLGGHDWGNEKVERASERLLTPGEVASLFRVDPKTVTRWAASGRISSIRTPGGHRRFRESEVRALLLGEPSESTPRSRVLAGTTPEVVGAPASGANSEISCNHAVARWPDHVRIDRRLGVRVIRCAHHPRRGNPEPPEDLAGGGDRTVLHCRCDPVALTGGSEQGLA